MTHKFVKKSLKCLKVRTFQDFMRIDWKSFDIQLNAALEGFEGKSVFVLVQSAIDVETGRMWCPDCEKGMIFTHCL